MMRSEYEMFNPSSDFSNLFDSRGANKRVGMNFWNDCHCVQHAGKSQEANSRIFSRAVLQSGLSTN
jgi:hypothetical protein